MYEFYSYYMSINLKDYPNIGIDMKIGWVLLALTVGIMIAAIIITLQRNSMIGLIRKLSRSEARDEESARTLSELGLDNFMVRGLLNSSGRLKRLVKRVGEKELTYDEYVALTKKKKRRKKDSENAPEEEQTDKQSGRADYKTARFYLIDEGSDETKKLAMASRSSLLNTILFCILLVCIYICLMLLMPEILSLLDNFLANN